MDERFAALDRAAAAVGARTPEALEERIAALQGELRETKRRLRGGRRGRAGPSPATSPARAEEVGARDCGSSGPPSTSSRWTPSRASPRTSAARLPSGVIALGLDAEEPQLFVTVSDDLVARGIAAGSLVQGAVTAIDGRGGGRPEMAQGKGTRREGLGDAIAAVRAAAAARAGAA